VARLVTVRALAVGPNANESRFLDDLSRPVRFQLPPFAQKYVMIPIPYERDGLFGPNLGPMVEGETMTVLRVQARREAYR